ncbi:MAG: hypothetical protein V3T96_00800 [Thermodesulfobacteriota bacterium]
MNINNFMRVALVCVVVFTGIIAIKLYTRSEYAYASLSGNLDYIQVLSEDFRNGTDDYIILLDSRNGNIWAYQQDALYAGFDISDQLKDKSKDPEKIKKVLEKLERKYEPVYLGKLKELGKTIQYRKGSNK